MQGPPVLPAPRLGPQVRSGLINRTQQTGGGGGAGLLNTQRDYISQSPLQPGGPPSQAIPCSASHPSTET